MNKVQLKAHKIPAQFSRHTKSINSSLPFFISRQANSKYYHRVRSAAAHWKDGKLSHISISFWCGNGGFLGRKGKLLGEVPIDGLLCATCHGRAIGSGVDGDRVINGQKVMYKPTI